MKYLTIISYFIIFLYTLTSPPPALSGHAEDYVNDFYRKSDELRCKNFVYAAVNGVRRIVLPDKVTKKWIVLYTDVVPRVGKRNSLGNLLVMAESINNCGVISQLHDSNNNGIPDRSIKWIPVKITINGKAYIAFYPTDPVDLEEKDENK